MTVVKHKDQRVGIFIDAQNIYHSAKNIHRAKVNFAKVVQTALAGRHLVRCIAYVISSEAGDEQGFFEALVKAGIETRTKDLQVFAGGAKKADWDVGIAIDAVSMAPKLDAVILISGDGDFIPLVRHLQLAQGCQVEVAAFGKSTSSKLIEAVDDFLDLDDNPKQYLLQDRIKIIRGNR
jgi:uncharacterized LabA/DUF88 family protein